MDVNSSKYLVVKLNYFRRVEIFLNYWDAKIAFTIKIGDIAFIIPLRWHKKKIRYLFTLYINMVVFCIVLGHLTVNIGSIFVLCYTTSNKTKLICVLEYTQDVLHRKWCEWNLSSIWKFGGTAFFMMLQILFYWFTTDTLCRLKAIFSLL